MKYDGLILGEAFQIIRRSPTVRWLGIAAALASVPFGSYNVDEAWKPLTTLVLPVMALLVASRIEAAFIIASDRVAKREQPSVQAMWQSSVAFIWPVFAMRVIFFFGNYVYNLLPAEAAFSCLYFAYSLIWIFIVGTIIDLSVRAVILHGQTVKAGLGQGTVLMRTNFWTIIRVWIGIMIWITIIIAILLMLALVVQALLPVKEWINAWETFVTDWPPVAWLLTWLALTLIGWLPTAWMSVIWTLFFRAAAGPEPIETSLENDNSAALT